MLLYIIMEEGEMIKKMIRRTKQAKPVCLTVRL